MLKNAAFELFLMLGSTYICECAFSAMSNIKSKNRNQLGNNTTALQGCLRMNTTSILVDTSAVVKHADLRSRII